MRAVNIECFPYISDTQVRMAEKHGASAVIFYTDPADFTLAKDPHVYPDAWWLPPTGVHSGTIYLGDAGDPLTPGYPSIGKYDIFDQLFSVFISIALQNY